MKMEVEGRRMRGRSRCRASSACFVLSLIPSTGDLRKLRCNCSDWAERLQCTRHNCLALHFWQIQAAKKKANLPHTTAPSSTKVRPLLCNTLISLPATPSIDRASRFPSVRSLRSSQAIPAFQGLVFHVRGWEWDADLENFMPAESHNPHTERRGTGTGPWAWAWAWLHQMRIFVLCAPGGSHGPHSIIEEASPLSHFVHQLVKACQNLLFLGWMKCRRLA